MRHQSVLLRAISRNLTLFALFLTVAILSLRQIHLVTADLGRHITNGKALLENSTVLNTNFYSYTYPEEPFVNHHWGSGLLFYGIYQWLGFDGLSFLHMILTVTAFALIFLVSKNLTSTTDAALASLVVLPLLISRSEIRPELFSFVMTGAFYYILASWRTNRLSSNWLALLPLLMIIWVNLHIYFFMGPLLIALFALDTKDRQAFRDLVTIFSLTLAAMFVSPMSLEIALYPLRIFENYGYMIAENQSVPFFWQRDMVISGYGSFHGTTLALGISIGLLALMKTPFSRAFVAIAFITWALALSAIRNFALFGLCAIPALAMVGYIMDATRLRFAWRILLISVAFCGLYYDFSRLAPTLKYTWGSGLAPGVNSSAEFFKRENLQGPIFNNYDIGGYLIYHLFPDARVFVDNRPEAYPSDFFEKKYMPMQEDDNIWGQSLVKYRFNTIYFYLRDNTPAGQKFLISRVGDPNWVPIYVDQDAIIFVRNTASNQAVIEKYALPREMFRVSSKAN
jgi:hypothetical protein